MRWTGGGWFVGVLGQLVGCRRGILGHHRLGVEQLARIPGQRQLGLELGDALVGRGQLVGLHARGAVDDSRVDQRLALPLKQIA